MSSNDVLGHFFCQVLKTSKECATTPVSYPTTPLSSWWEGISSYPVWTSHFNLCHFNLRVVETMVPCPRWSPVVMGVRRRGHSVRGLQCHPSPGWTSPTCAASQHERSSPDHSSLSTSAILLKAHCTVSSKSFMEVLNRPVLVTDPVVLPLLGLQAVNDPLISTH